jgi:hypothetical protein
MPHGSRGRRRGVHGGWGASFRCVWDVYSSTSAEKKLENTASGLSIGHFFINTDMPRTKRPHPYGPVTTQLKPLQQRFIEVLMAHPTVGQAEALKMAGHKGSYDAVNKMAYRLMHNPMVLEALKEGAVAQLGGMVPRVVKALSNIIDNPSDRNHYKAIDGLLNRTGFHEVKEQKTTVTHEVDTHDLIAKIRAMTEKLGIASIDPDKLRGLAPSLDESSKLRLLKPAPVVKNGDTLVLTNEDRNDPKLIEVAEDTQ